MNKKTQLPDELLDAVSGGYLYLGKEKVLSHEINEEYFIVTTNSGKYRMEGNPEFYKGKPGMFAKDKAIIDGAASSQTEHIALFKDLFKEI